MKKIFFSIVTMLFLAVAVNAQTADVSKANKAAEKEAKEKAKEKQNKEIDDAINRAGFSEAEAAKFREVTASYGAKSTEIRKTASLSDEQKEAQLKAKQEEKNNKLKEIVGEEKYKAFNKIRKAQKEAAASSGNN